MLYKKYLSGDCICMAVLFDQHTHSVMCCQISSRGRSTSASVTVTVMLTCSDKDNDLEELNRDRTRNTSQHANLCGGISGVPSMTTTTLTH